MPNTKSAKKHLKQSIKRNARNKSVKSRLRNEMKNVRTAITAGKLEDAAKEIVTAQTILDRAASRGVIHKNKAARLKSRMSKNLKAAKAKK